MGVPNPRGNDQVVAAYVVADGSIGRGDLLAFCKGKLANFKVPESIEFISQVPRNALGKVVRQLVERIVTEFITSEILQLGSPESLTPERLLLDEGILDSLGLQQLVTFLEAEFSIKIDDDYLMPENFASVRAIASIVNELRSFHAEPGFQAGRPSARQ